MADRPSPDYYALARAAGSGQRIRHRRAHYQKDAPMTHSNVDEHHLPRKLAHVGAAGRIKNIRGIEYRLGLPAASTAGAPS